ncbi:hypothetical protein TSAR_015594 [Trichomalopsis sarcophagae]|uniref:TPX2 C-terminal domain-containing protein n=1 Tax=Trichomalopsis sarcophagae TaxID=543379 RepID=A0A232EQ68_9HYME|nr:hypothetical protein TSAR_015594 [Trichomalopsis sarcophagae]
MVRPSKFPPMIMESPDIKNSLTPISLHTGVANHGARALWKYQCGRSTSTPLNGCSSSNFQGRHLRSGLESSLLDNSYLQLDESPILFAHPKVKLAAVLTFGRKLSLENDRLSTTGVAATFGKMGIMEMSEEFTAESSSSSSHTDEIKKQINKVKKRKSTSPKQKSPKIYKTTKKVTDADGGHSKKIGSSGKLKMSAQSTKKRMKSPKSKSPTGFRIGPFRKVVPSSSSSKKLISINKQTTNSESSDKCSMKRSPIRNGSQCPTLKLSRCPRSPKLQTAVRAMIKQQKEEIRKQKEIEMEEYKNKLLEEQRRKEEEEILKMRQERVFKAKPIRKYVPLPVVKKRALTDPISPNLCKRRRVETSSHSTNSHRTQ